MYRVTVKSGCIHNENDGPGSVLVVDEHELEAFQDKFTNIEAVDVAETQDASESNPPGSEDESEKEKPADNEPAQVSASYHAEGLAEEHGIDLSQVEGTGSDGKILKSDVEKLVDG